MVPLGRSQIQLVGELFKTHQTLEALELHLNDKSAETLNPMALALESHNRTPRTLLLTATTNVSLDPQYHNNQQYHLERYEHHDYQQTQKHPLSLPKLLCGYAARQCHCTPHSIVTHGS